MIALAWTIELSEHAEKELSKLDRPVAKRIYRELIEIEQLDDPRSRGKALTGNLSGLWRYRVGDYRVICSIDDDVLVIFAIEIAHRSKVYKGK